MTGTPTRPEPIDITRPHLFEPSQYLRALCIHCGQQRGAFVHETGSG